MRGFGEVPFGQDVCSKDGARSHEIGSPGQAEHSMIE